ncbi:MAG: GntR family transcriptional regulator [Candidatus Obscuribacterales bacterium]|nr:GntR family transcriptional regulator [Candidatus Obscuribacterales bacterium]
MLSTHLRISISKKSAVPIRDQLIEQIALQIASGNLQTKDKLPSIRALAQKLDVHPSTITAVYNHLADAGLLEIRQGSGVRVIGQTIWSDNESNSLPLLFRQFLAKATETGESRNTVRSFVLAQLNAAPVKRILVVDRNPDFHAILSSELQPHFSLPVQPITFDSLQKEQTLLKDSIVIASYYHLLPLQSLELDPTRFILSQIEPGQEEIKALTGLRPGDIAAIISVSPTLLRMAANMAAAVRGEEIILRCLSLDDDAEIAYVMKHANLVICDRPSQEKISKLSGKIPTRVFSLYPESTIQAIHSCLKNWG